MFGMETWQWVVVGLVAAVCVGYMSYAIAGMFSRRAEATATERGGTAFESGLAGADVPTGAAGFDVWSYRVSARFAGKSRLLVTGDAVSVAGPRVPLRLYQAWVWVQGLLLALVPAALVWGAVRLDWRPLLLGAGVFLLSLGISSLGAGIWPGLGEMAFLADGNYTAVEFPRSSVRDVMLGEGWARGGMDVVLLPYVKGIDALAVDHCVSFYAPDASGREVRYALHVPDAEKARELAGLLKAGR